MMTAEQKIKQTSVVTQHVCHKCCCLHTAGACWYRGSKCLCRYMVATNHTLMHVFFQFLAFCRSMMLPFLLAVYTNEYAIIVTPVTPLGGIRSKGPLASGEAVQGGVQDSCSCSKAYIGDTKRKTYDHTEGAPGGMQNMPGRFATSSDGHSGRQSQTPW